MSTQRELAAKTLVGKPDEAAVHALLAIYDLLDKHLPERDRLAWLTGPEPGEIEAYEKHGTCDCGRAIPCRHCPEIEPPPDPAPDRMEEPQALGAVVVAQVRFGDWVEELPFVRTPTQYGTDSAIWFGGNDCYAWESLVNPRPPTDAEREQWGLS